LPRLVFDHLTATAKKIELNPELEEGFDEDKYIYEVDPSAVTISTSDDSVPVPVSRVEPVGAVISVQSVTPWAAP
jgi:hypothetical protein